MSLFGQTGEVLDAIDAKRAEVLDIARLEIGPHGKGSPRVLTYWRAVTPDLTEAQRRQCARDRRTAAGSLRTRDGNQPGGAARSRPRKPKPFFFGIEGLILEWLDLPSDGR